MSRLGGLGIVLLAVGLAVGCTGSTPGSDSSTVGGSAPEPAVDRPISTPSMVPATQRWWDDDTFYEIFVRSFKDSDGDGVGDLRGVIEQLDYLNDGDPATTTDLGVTGLWLMPVFASPSYHGYDVTDFRSVNPAYGTIDDLRTLLDQAHARGISVIVDLPLNHTSVEHPWFQASRLGQGEYADWYVWREGASSEPGPWGQRVWHNDGDRSYLGIFWKGMPDLNLRDPGVTAELRDVARFWLSQGVDGFRLDAAQHLVEEGDDFDSNESTRSWLAGFNSYVKSVRPDALLVGEIWSDSATSASYVPGQVDLAFDFGSADHARDLALVGSAAGLLDATENNLALYPDWQAAVFTDNHDRGRLASLAFDDPDRLRMIATWQLTQPGTPFLYYGQEIGLTGVKPDEQIRTPMPWSAATPAAGFTTATPWEPLKPGWDERNVAAQWADPDSLLNHVARLISVRSASPALRTGDFRRLPTDDARGFAYLRRLGEEQVVVLGNASREPLKGLTITLPEPSKGKWTSLLGQQVAQPDGTRLSPIGTLAPWATAIVRLGS